MEEEVKTAPSVEEEVPLVKNTQPDDCLTAKKPAGKNGLSMKENPTKYITTSAILVALAFVVMVAIHIKAGFLTYDPKDVVIAIGGFMFGPLIAIIVSVLVPLLEMISVSDTQFWGMFMNILSSVSFTLTASLIYKYKRSLKGAVMGLATAVVITTIIMLPANYLIIPLYTPANATYVVEQFLPVIIPFNLLKGAINATIIMLLYKPLMRAFRHANMLPAEIKPVKEGTIKSFKTDIITAAVSALLIVAAFILFFVWKSHNF
jgi:riboflavin transporter FmnP